MGGVRRAWIREGIGFVIIKGGEETGERPLLYGKSGRVSPDFWLKKNDDFHVFEVVFTDFSK